MRYRKPVAALAAVAAITVAAACSSAPPNAPAVGTPAANALVCQHYLRQYAWKQNLAFPTVADALKWEGYVAADQAEAALGTKLSHDLGQEYLAMQGKPNTYKNGTVYHDCA